MFIAKYLLDGTVEHHKAHLVAKGYTLTYGVDYAETLSLVAKIGSMHFLTYLAATLGWPLF